MVSRREDRHRILVALSESDAPMSCRQITNALYGSLDPIDFERCRSVISGLINQMTADDLIRKAGKGHDGMSGFDVWQYELTEEARTGGRRLVFDVPKECVAVTDTGYRVVIDDPVPFMDMLYAQLHGKGGSQ